MNNSADSTQLHITIGRLVGMGRRSGGVRIGVRASMDSIRGNRCRLILFARDASPRTRKLIQREAVKVPLIPVESEDMLGKWVGRNTVAAVAVVDANLASGILNALPDPGQNDSSAES